MLVRKADKNDGNFIESLIFAIICVIIANIIFNSEHTSGNGLFLFLSILFIPVILIVWAIANAIRRAIRPDVVISSGFWGLLKGKIFWRIGPQVILSLIVLAILMNCAVSYVENRPVEDIESLFFKLETIFNEMHSIVELERTGKLTPNHEARYNQLEEELINVFEELVKHEKKLTEDERLKLYEMIDKFDTYK